MKFGGSMSDGPKLVSEKRADGMTTAAYTLKPEVLQAKSRELMAFLQLLTDSDKVMALAVLQATLESCKRMWRIEGDVILSENPLQ